MQLKQLDNKTDTFTTCLVNSIEGESTCLLRLEAKEAAQIQKRDPNQ